MAKPYRADRAPQCARSSLVNLALLRWADEQGTDLNRPRLVVVGGPEGATGAPASRGLSSSAPVPPSGPAGPDEQWPIGRGRSH